MQKQLLFTLFFLVLLSGCSTNAPIKITDVPLATTIAERNQQLQALNHWLIKGKIAFIEQKKRQSASLFWQFNQQTHSRYQQIDLTTFLGINILHVESNNNHHIIEVDGKTYQGNNLSALIYSLTAIKLPTEALNYWLKGIAYSKQDKLTYQQNSLLPQTLEGFYNKQKWQVKYNKYRFFQGYQLPTSLTIKQNDITIKVKIDKWSIL